MVTDAERIAYCKDHLPYELLMLYFSHDSLQRPVHILAANSFIESLNDSMKFMSYSNSTPTKVI